MNEDEMVGLIEDMISFFNDEDNIKECIRFRDAGVLTNDKGLELETYKGEKFHLIVKKVEN